MDGLWSDVDVSPTLLEALGVRDSRSFVKQPSRGATRHNVASALTSPNTATARPGFHDIFGRSILSGLGSPPQHQMLSCTFDHSCAAVVAQNERGDLWKFVSSLGGGRLEAYRLNADRYEERDRSSELPQPVRSRAVAFIHTWVRAMQDVWLPSQ